MDVPPTAPGHGSWRGPRAHLALPCPRACPGCVPSAGWQCYCPRKQGGGGGGRGHTTRVTAPLGGWVGGGGGSAVLAGGTQGQWRSVMSVAAGGSSGPHRSDAVKWGRSGFCQTFWASDQRGPRNRSAIGPSGECPPPRDV